MVASLQEEEQGKDGADAASGDALIGRRAPAAPH